MIKKWWKYSSLRIYVLNTLHNYDFWLNAKKVFTTIEFKKTGSFRDFTTEKESRKRFVGYNYKGKIYLDNPGLNINERDVWESWKRKKLL